MSNGKLIAALIEIRRRAMESFCFDSDSFSSRNIDELCENGGDICDWTMIAIEADDALEEFGLGIKAK